MKEIASKSFKWHLGVLLVSMIFSLSIVVIAMVSLGKNVNYTSEDFAKKYSAFPFKNYYYQFQIDNNEAFHALKYTLKNGEIALFGSSELTSNKSRFTPYNFFSENLGVNLRAFGHAGFQNKAIITELLSVMNPEVLENGRVVIMISPSWFQDGKRMHEGLWSKEVASDVVLSRIRENESVDKKFKEFLLGKEFKLNPLYSADKVLRKIVDKNFMSLNPKIDKISAKTVSIDWNKWKKESQVFEKNISSNEYGINNEYFDQYVKPKIGTPNFPFKIEVKGDLNHNEEIQDFEFLLEVLTRFKHKPQFIILPLSRKAYSNLELLDPTMTYIEKKIQEKQYPLLNFWPLTYEAGVLTDVMHTGAYGWVLINEFVYENHLHQ